MRCCGSALILVLIKIILIPITAPIRPISGLLVVRVFAHFPWPGVGSLACAAAHDV